LATDSDLRRWRQSVVKLTTFFPTFAPTFFLFFNFQSKNFWDFQLSNRKKFAVPTFAAKFFGRKKFQIVQTGTDRPENFLPPCAISVVISKTKGTFPSFRSDRFKIFRRECPYNRKNSGTTAQKKYSIV
jgi:hypothetical protein